MKTFKINSANKALLRKASSTDVENYYVSFPAHERRVKWIRLNNRYRVRCVNRYEADVKAVPPTVNSQQLTDYISASAPAHVIDGWSFLGRAVDAMLRGDSYSAVHFAYYAELRAAMGLLASEGIGILSNQHTILESSATTHHFPQPGKKGTHAVIWPILRYWSTLSRAADRLDELIQPDGISMTTWLRTTVAPLPVRALARLWLRCWGLDLSSVVGDHNFRNLASYRPSEFRKPLALDPNVIAEFTQDLWNLFEPGGARRFPVLERMLLRSAFQSYATATPSAAQVQGIGLGLAEATEWATFLAAADNLMPFRVASESRTIEHAECHLGVIARASFLLHLSTAAARRLLTNASYNGETVSFWWARHGEERGLWDVNGAPENPLDQWADIALSLTSSQDWRVANPLGGGGSLRQWRRATGTHADDLGAFELVGIWGLMP